jgi:hypothetical protein
MRLVFILLIFGDRGNSDYLSFKISIILLSCLV